MSRWKFPGLVNTDTVPLAPLQARFDKIEPSDSKMRMLNGSRLSINGVFSILGVDWLIAAVTYFSSTTALRLAE